MVVEALRTVVTVRTDRPTFRAAVRYRWKTRVWTLLSLGLQHIHTAISCESGLRDKKGQQSGGTARLYFVRRNLYQCDLLIEYGCATALLILVLQFTLARQGGIVSLKRLGMWREREREGALTGNLERQSLCRWGNEDVDLRDGGGFFLLGFEGDVYTGK